MTFINFLGIGCPPPNVDTKNSLSGGEICCGWRSHGSIVWFSSFITMKDTVSPGSGLRFIIVGTLMAAVYFGLFLLLHSLAGFRPLEASAIAYPACAFISYIFHRSWSFQSEEPVRESLPKYLILQFSCLVMTAISTQVAYVLFDIDGLQISILTTIFAGTISFFVSSLWVFSDAKKGSK
jgi:putative flippase GtrA